MLYYVIYYDILLVYYAIMSVQIRYCPGRRRAMFLPDPQKAIVEFDFVSVQQNSEELFERELRLFDAESVI